ncbi:MAG TPA: serine/threonine protein kinase [Mycobacterium sp.]|nr:serine/threonine protein kinase [Mycobacterium sp.]HTX94104.1 serine/threonine protein kinase [Mycobacterium sp.]
MPCLSNALQTSAAVALMTGFGLAGFAPATADPAANTGNASDVNTLAAALSKGYGLNNCTAQSISGNQLAALTCGQNPDPGGPVQAKYYLFSNTDAMNAFFTTNIKDDVLTSCGTNSTRSPSPWHQGSATNTGQMACGTYQNAAEIIWTNDAKHVLSYIRGSNTDAASLYQWWQANG